MKSKVEDWQHDWNEEDEETCEQCGGFLVQKRGRLMCPKCDRDKKKTGKPARIQLQQDSW